MNDIEKIINKTKEYILNLHAEGYSTHKSMVSGLKNGIDYFVGQSTGDVESLKNEIIATCLQEFEIRTKFYNKAGHLKKIEIIKSEFEHFVKNLDPTTITAMDTIAFERRLDAEASEALTAALKDKFDFDAWKGNNYYWAPLAQPQSKEPFLYFNDELFKEPEIETLIAIIQSISGDRIYQLTEEKIHYEVDCSTLHFDWRELAYCDFKTSWLIYISHEGTIAFAGPQLLAELANKLPGIMDHKNPWE